MGDRANVAIKQEMKDEHGNDTYIYLYTHWLGLGLPLMVQAALKRGQSRWGHTAYLTRIIFSEMIKEEVEETTGYGISNMLGDNGHPIIYIDDKAQTVRIKNTTWTYQDFIELTQTQIYQVYSNNEE